MELSKQNEQSDIDKGNRDIDKKARQIIMLREKGRWETWQNHTLKNNHHSIKNQPGPETRDDSFTIV